MITANELRIGNWIMYNDQNETPQPTSIQIDIQDLILINENVKDCNYQPIPLTEELLLKCGFDCFEDGWYRKQITPIEFTWNIYDYTLRVMGYSFGAIKSLHELQNLYYALTKNELIINL